jgi:hypothetical protein
MSDDIRTWLASVIATLPECDKRLILECLRGYSVETKERL